MKTRTIIILFVLLGQISTTLGQRLSNLELTPREITVGDPIELVLKVKAGDGARVIWPGPDELAPLEILSVDTLPEAGEEQAVRYQVSFYEPGEQDLEEIPIVLSREDGTDTLWVEAGYVMVSSVLESTDSLAGIRDVHPPKSLGWTFRDLLPYLMVLAALLIVGIGLYLLWRWNRKRKGELPEYVPSPQPAHEIALRRLIQLQEKRLWQNGYLKEFYSELTDIVKEYIGGRFEFNAPEMTTEELLDRQVKWSSGQESYLKVRRILTCADLVKFAKFKPDPQENERCLEAGFEYVEDSRPKLQVVAEEASQKTESGVNSINLR